MPTVSEGLHIVVAMVISFVVFAATVRSLASGVVALVLSVPVQAEFALKLGSVELTWTKVLLGVTVAAWIVRILVGASRPKIDALALAFGCYVLTLIVSIVNARDVSAWAGETYRWIVALVVYLMAAEAFVDSPNVNQLLIAMAGAIFAVAVSAGWQIATDAGPATFSVDGLTRVYATFGEPNPFAGYLEMSVLLLVAVLAGWAAQVRAWKGPTWLAPRALILMACSVLAGVGALFATQSRGGYVGFAIGLAVVIWLTGGRIRWIGMVGGGICLLLVLLSPLGARVLDRFRVESLSTGPVQVTVDNWAAQERAAHWRAAIAMAEAAPVTGIGAGNYNLRYREATTVWRFRIPRGHAHNAYLQALAQAGLLGGIAYLAMLGVVAREIAKALKHHDDGIERALVIGVAAITMAVAVHNLVEYLHVLSLGIQLSVVWAILKVISDQGDPQTATSSSMAVVK